MHDDVAALTKDRGVRSLLENWHGAEWELGVHDECVEVASDTNSATLCFDAAPGLEFLTKGLGPRLAAAVND